MSPFTLKRPLIFALLPTLAVATIAPAQDGALPPKDFAASGIAASGIAAPDIVATGVDRHDRMTVPVQINGKGPFDFLVDTGARNTVVSHTLAGRLALTSRRRAMLVGMSGSRMVDTVDLEQVDLGPRSYYGLIAPLLDAGDIGAEGILGTDSLQGQRVVLDFLRHTIAIDDGKAAGSGDGYEIVVRARKRSGQLIMTNAVIDDIRVDVVIDTGASTTVGNRALQRAMRHRPGQQATLTGVTGQPLATDIGLARLLTINDLNTTNVLIAFADSPAFAELRLNRRPAIFLGMRELRAFNRVAIDFTSRRILFDIPGAAQGTACRQWATRLNCQP